MPEFPSKTKSTVYRLWCKTPDVTLVSMFDFSDEAEAWRERDKYTAAHPDREYGVQTVKTTVRQSVIGWYSRNPEPIIDAEFTESADA